MVVMFAKVALGKQAPKVYHPAMFPKAISPKRAASLLTPTPLLIALAIAGCNSEPAPQKLPADAAESELAGNVVQPADFAQPADTAIREKVGEIEFDYSWPQAAARIPELDAWLRGNGEHLRAQTLDKARIEEASAREAGYPFRGYTYEERWGVVADLPALLVMQSEGYTFTGGAHGMLIVTILIWDKAREQRLSANALLDMAQLKDGLNDRFCSALDAERAKRRGEAVRTDDPNEISDFVRCVDFDRQIIVPVSLKGQALDTIRIVIMPYEAGPYAEGIYQLDLPVDEAVMRAVKPAYRAAFARS